MTFWDQAFSFYVSFLVHKRTGMVHGHMSFTNGFPQLKVMGFKFLTHISRGRTLKVFDILPTFTRGTLLSYATFSKSLSFFQQKVVHSTSRVPSFAPCYTVFIHYLIRISLYHSTKLKSPTLLINMWQKSSTLPNRTDLKELQDYVVHMSMHSQVVAITAQEIQAALSVPAHIRVSIIVTRLSKFKCFFLMKWAWCHKESNENEITYFLQVK